jgi:Ca2+-binding EF-hand superfamily protein
MKKMLVTGIFLSACSAFAAWDWFAALDADKNGVVTEAEWVAWTGKEAAKKGEKFVPEQSKKWFARRDLNQDGQMTREEFNSSKGK